MKRPFGRGITPVKGLAITMLINHLITGMILQVYFHGCRGGWPKHVGSFRGGWYCQMRLVQWITPARGKIHGIHIASMYGICIDLYMSHKINQCRYTIRGWYVICNVWILLHICQNECVLIIINQQHQHTGETTDMQTEQIWTNRNA